MKNIAKSWAKPEQLLGFALLLSTCLHIVILLIPVKHHYAKAHLVKQQNNVNNTRLTVHLVALNQPNEISTMANPESNPTPTSAPEVPNEPITSNENNQPASDEASPVTITPIEHYYAATELDVRPKVNQDIDLNPDELRGYSAGGKVFLRLWINEEGAVEKVEATQSELPENIVQVAIRNFMRATFFPGKKEQLAVKSVIDVVWVVSAQP